MTQYDQIKDMMHTMFYNIKFYNSTRKDQIFERIIEDIFHDKEYSHVRGYMNKNDIKDLKNVYEQFKLNYSNKVIFNNQSWLFSESTHNLQYKMYITAMPNKLSRVAFDVLNYLTKNKIPFEIGCSLKHQNTNIVLHLSNIEDANKLVKFITSDKEYYQTMIGSNIPILPRNSKLAFIQESNKTKRTYLELSIGYLYSFVELMTLGNRSKECNPDYFMEYIRTKSNGENIIIKRFNAIKEKSIIEAQKKLTK